VKSFGRVDTLLANAGPWESRDVPLDRMRRRRWQRRLDGVLITTFVSVREFFRLVAKQKRGNAVLIASTPPSWGR
jgi:NAD(P)-dependent dehydrogenase (short-subunit alcohol dehydrogenase family)